MVLLYSSFILQIIIRHSIKVSNTLNILKLFHSIEIYLELVDNLFYGVPIGLELRTLFMLHFRTDIDDFTLKFSLHLAGVA